MCDQWACGYIHIDLLAEPTLLATTMTQFNEDHLVDAPARNHHVPERPAEGNI